MDKCREDDMILIHSPNLNVPSLLYWSRPDMTFAVDWALTNNYLSIYPVVKENMPKIHHRDVNGV